MATDFVLVHIVTRLELGGAQLATLYQVQHTQFGVRPRHLIFGPGGMLDDVARALADVRCWPVCSLQNPLRPARDLKAVRELVGVLKAIQKMHPGRMLVVHTHSSKAGILGRWAARFVGAACIVHTIHGFGHHRHMSKVLFAGLWAAEQATACITSGFTADSQANLERGQKEGLLGDRPRCVVRCGIDVSAFAAAQASLGLKERLGIDAADAVVLGVACLKPQKDPLTWVEVARRVLLQRPQTTFLLAGDGVLRPQVAAAIAQARIAAKCRLLGWRHDVAALMNLCDVVLHTSLWEGLPQVFAQAMACARPVVATCVDGAPEAIETGVTGLLRPAQDAAGLSADVLRLLIDPDFARSLGRAAASRVEQFSQTRMLRDLEAFYGHLGQRAAARLTREPR